MADVPAPPFVAEDGFSEIRETESVIKLAIGEQTTVRRDASTVKFEFDPAVETESQRSLFGFTDTDLWQPRAIVSRHVV